MKKLIFALAIFPMFAYPSGKIQVKPGYFMKAEKFGGQLGISIWEPVFSSIKFTQWFGIGTQPRVMDDSVFYAVSETALGSWFGRTGIFIGYKFQHADKASNDLISEHSVFLKAEYQLW